MPVIINELIIRATVNDSAASAQSPGNSSSQNINDREAIIAQCVEQILEILEKKKER